MTGSRPISDGRAPVTPTPTSSAEHSQPARRRGRHSRQALGTSAVPVTVFTARHLLVPTAGGDPAHGIKVRPAEVGLSRSTATSGRSTSYDGFEVYAAASLARRSARDTVVRLATSMDRVRVAGQTVAPAAAPGPSGELSSGADAIVDAAGHRLDAIQRAERRLDDALEALDAAKVVVGNADRELRRFHPHGGTLVVTLPTRRRALDRLHEATSAAGTCYYIADNATYSLVKEIVAGERAVRAVDHLVGYLLDHGLSPAIAPPPFLRLVRAALPPSQQLDWWRELCSLFAECRPDERRAQVASQGLNALRTIWTAWTVSRGPTMAPLMEKMRGPGGPGERVDDPLP